MATIIHQVPPFISYLLTTYTFILGVVCTISPNNIESLFVPCIDEKLLEHELFVRLLGSILIAYTLSCLSCIFFITAKKEGSRNDIIENEEDDDNDTMDCRTKFRLTLASFAYLGMAFFLSFLFHTLKNNDDTRITSSVHNDCKSSGMIKFLKLIVISVTYVLLSLIGLMCSFYPRQNNIAVNSTETTENIDRRMNCFKSILCWKDQSNTSLSIYSSSSLNMNESNHDNTVPLLSNDHLENNETDEQDQMENQQNGIHEIQEQRPILTSGNRIKGCRRLLKLAGKHSLYLYSGCLVLLIRLPFSLSIPHFVSSTIAAIAKANYDDAKMNILFLFIFGTIDAALDFWCIFLFGLTNLKITKNIRIDLFSSILKQEVAFFDNAKSGELASRLNSDCGEMASDLTWFFRFSIESTVRIVGIVAYMLLRSPELGLCAISVVPIVAFVNKKYGDWLHKNAKAVQEKLAEANSVAQEALSCIRTVIAFASEKHEHCKYDTKVGQHYKLNIKQLYATGFYYMAISTFLINTCVQSLLLYMGMILIQNDEMNTEILLAFMLYQSQLQSEVMNLFNSYTSLVKSSGAGDKVFELLDRVTPPPGVGHQSDFTQGEGESQTINVDLSNGVDIAFENVHFSYPTRPDEPILRDLNLNIPSGKTVALVGASGCGKTTILSLIQRFYDTTSGGILINGIDVKKVDLHEYRRNIGVVTQDPTLFTGTIRSNIAYSRMHETSNEEIIKAAKLANAHEFITNFYGGYDTQVGERGIQLSGGQKQRIAIARAILSKPPLLLLDEATSSLDAESETLVQAAIDKFLSEERRDMTTIVIAHRLRTIQNADIILFLNNDGEIVEQGTHTVLLNNLGPYYEMVQNSKIGV